MASRLFLSNDTVTGNKFHEHTFILNPLVNATSAHGQSASNAMAFVAPANGKIVDFFFGVGAIGESAANFTGCNVSCNVRINSVSCLTTIPVAFGPVVTASYGPAATNKGAANTLSCVSAVVNAASAVFSAGDIITVDHNTQSLGGGAAANPGKGLAIGIVVRYEAS